MQTKTKPRAGANSKPKRDINSPAAQALRKKVVYHDPKQWDKDIETGAGDL
jgi:hypothetical protein